MSRKQDNFIDARELSLREWLSLLQRPAGPQFIDYEFPTDDHRSEYLATIRDRSEDEVIELLRHFLVPSMSLGKDKTTMKVLLAEEGEKLKASWRIQYYRRLMLWTASRGKKPPPWEGITWVLDLLPHFPRQALEGLDAYFLAHAQFLPDGRFRGLADAATLIREKFIGAPDNDADALELLMGVNPRHFECVVERMYAAMGYDTHLTPERADGGRDILAKRTKLAETEQCLIECKRYSGPVGVKEPRALLGAVSHEKSNKGVIVTTSRFTRPAHDFAALNPRIELIQGDQLIQLLNEFLGARWPLHIERLVSESLKKNGSDVSLDVENLV